jgi:hypothetical protein
MPSAAKLVAAFGLAATLATAAPTIKRQAALFNVKAGSQLLYNDDSAPGNGLSVNPGSPSSSQFYIGQFFEFNGTLVPGIEHGAYTAYVQSSTGLVVFENSALAASQGNDIVVPYNAGGQLQLEPYNKTSDYKPYLCDGFLYLTESIPYSGCGLTSLTAASQ